MKQPILYLLAVAALLLAACSERDDEGIMSSRAVQFESGVVDATRAGTAGPISNLNALKEEDVGFGVFAYFTDTEKWEDFNPKTSLTAGNDPYFMMNQRVEWDRSRILWYYEPVKYWPEKTSSGQDRYITFFAYAPYAAMTGSAASGMKTTDYADGTGIVEATNLVPTDGHQPFITYRLATASGTLATKQVDLMWGSAPQADDQSWPINNDRTRYDDGNIETETNDGVLIVKSNKVPFVFHHGLSCIDLYVKRVFESAAEQAAYEAQGDNPTKLFLNSVTLSAAAGQLNLEGKMDISNGAWQDGSYTSNASALAFPIEEADISTTLRGTADDAKVKTVELNGYAAKNGVTDTPQAVTGSTHQLMLIPKASGASFTADVAYSFVTRDDELALNSDLTDDDGHHYLRFTNRAEGVALTIPKLEGGKRYTVLLSIGVTNVSFEVVSVEDWDYPLRFSPTATDYEADDSDEIYKKFNEN